MTEDRTIRIGELLSASGVISSSDLTEAIQVSQRLQVPIGRVLIMSGCVSEEILRVSLDVQSLIRDELLTVDNGVDALCLVHNSGMPLESALEHLDCLPHTGGTTARLGELLVDSNIVSTPQLQQALRTCNLTGMPLGGTLVLQGVLSASLLPTVLQVQERVRAKTISKEEAIEELKHTFLLWLRAEKSVNTGSALYTSSDEDQEAAKMGRGPTAKIDEDSDDSLVADDAKPETFAQRRETLAAQRKATKETVKPSAKDKETGEDLKRSGKQQAAKGSGKEQPDKVGKKGKKDVKRQHMPPTTAKVPESRPPLVPEAMLKLSTLLRLSGFFSERDLIKDFQRTLDNQEMAPELLKLIGSVDDGTINDALRCRELLKQGKLRPEQAVFALSSVRSGKQDLDEALQELGLD